MPFSIEHQKNTPLGIATSHALDRHAVAVQAAARTGQPPVHIIAPDLELHLGSQKANALVGRMIREWLGPAFKVKGRKKWPRQHGTESGAVYAPVA